VPNLSAFTEEKPSYLPVMFKKINKESTFEVISLHGPTGPLKIVLAIGGHMPISLLVLDELIAFYSVYVKR
jgi:hypothetical protein